MAPTKTELNPPLDLTPTLVAKLRQSDQGAAEMLDGLYRERLTAFSLGYLGDLELTRDVVQDVFLKVLQSDTQPDHFRAWIYRICRNRCLDVRRNLSRRRDDQSLPDPSVLQANLTGHLTHLVQDERHQHLQEIIAELPEDQREALLLRYSEGLSRSEIAEVLDMPEGIVKSKLFHGLEKLRTHNSLIDD